MCAIVDANVADEVFGPRPSPAGREFYEWVDKAPHGHLVVGGKLYKELKKGSPGFREWAKQAALAGLMTVFDEKKVDDRTDEINFGNKSLIDEPRGRVYHTRDIHVPNDNKEFSNAHRRLLNDKRLCRCER